MNKIFVIFIAFILLFSNLVAAQESVEAGTTPDSVFYGLDRASEAIRLAFTFNHAKKAELHLKYAEERLAEAQKVIEKNKLKYVEKLMKDRDKQLNETNEEIAKAQSQGKNVTAILEKVEQATSKHISVLTALLDKVPESAKPHIQHAIEMSSKGREQALESIAKIKPAVNKTEEGVEVKKPGETPVGKHEISKGKKPEEVGKATEIKPPAPAQEAATGKGKLNIQVTDAKPELLNITSLIVTLSEIRVHAAGNASVSEEVCANQTNTIEVCANETITEIVQTCVNETTIETTCVNETINGTVQETCTNNTVIKEICTNQTINKTVTSCANTTETTIVCANETETQQSWFRVVEGPVTFDLIKIKNVKEFLGSKELGAGKYTQIRLNVDSAKLFLSGQEKSFKIPSGSIKLINSFLIENGKTKTLTLDFDADKSVHQAGSMYIMRPTIKVIEE